jgi:hypothetical protein
MEKWNKGFIKKRCRNYFLSVELSLFQYFIIPPFHAERA